jgi:hypothetical protein
VGVLLYNLHSSEVCIPKVILEKPTGSVEDLLSGGSENGFGEAEVHTISFVSTSILIPESMKQVEVDRFPLAEIN